jgi:hypothetical protein
LSNNPETANGSRKSRTSNSSCEFRFGPFNVNLEGKTYPVGGAKTKLGAIATAAKVSTAGLENTDNAIGADSTTFPNSRGPVASSA